jgi:hypothetical protein
MVNLFISSLHGRVFESMKISINFHCYYQNENEKINIQLQDVEMVKLHTMILIFHRVKKIALVWVWRSPKHY